MAASRSARFTTVDGYLAAQAADVQPVLAEIRRRLLRLMPGAEETISYQMPTLKVAGSPVVHFAAWKHHVSLYPAPAETGDADFEREFAPHRGDKGTATFPYVDSMPYDLIERMVEHLLQQRRPGRD